MMEPSKPIAKWSEASVGDTVRLADGRTVLVGNVNELGGLCDDCMEQSKPVAIVYTRADFDALAAEAADARTLRTERDSLRQEREEASERADNNFDSYQRARDSLSAATARADALAALLKEARGAVGPFLRLLAKSYEIVMPSLRGLFALSKRRHRVEAVIARIDAELEKQP